MRPLTTERLELLPVTPGNARRLWRVLQQPNLRDFQDIPRITLEEFERQVRSRPTNLDPRSAGRFEWLLRERESGADVGWISLRINDRARRHGEFGYSLLAEARSKGYATESLSAIAEEAFAQTQLDEVHACTIPDNQASRNVLERVGFLESRVLKGGALVRNRRVDVVLYVYTRAQYLTRKRQAVAG